MEIAYWQWICALSAGFFLGLSKSGIKGISVLIVTLMALAFGSKASTGVVLPLLIAGDIFAVSYYNRYAEWKYLWKLLPWMLVGVLIGVVVGQDLPELHFKRVMGVIIILTLAMMIWWERKKDFQLSTSGWLGKSFGAFMGLSAGITTMIGNLAGAFSNIYFLAMRLPKNNFIGTAAWLFFIVNLFKLPFHIFYWETITWDSAMLSLKILPGLLVGLVIGVRLVDKINDKAYRQMIIILTAIGALLIFIR